MRRVIAIVLLTMSAILVPIAVVGAWAQTELLDTDRFVENFAPLATHPEIQEVVTEQVTEAITTELLQLNPIAAALVNSIVRGQVERFVTSPQFAQIWEISLRETHARTITLLDGDPDAALQLGDDGLLSLHIGPIVAAVQESLVAQGVPMANLIPEVHHSIALVSSDSFTMIRTIYQVANFAGSWLLFVAAGLAVVGIVVAENRLRAIGWTSVGWVLTLGVLGGALVFTRGYAIERRPEFLSEDASLLMFDQFTAGLVVNLRWFVILSLVVGATSALTTVWRRSRTA